MKGLNTVDRALFSLETSRLAANFEVKVESLNSEKLKSWTGGDSIQALPPRVGKEPHVPRRVDPSWQLLIACNSMPSHTLEPALLGRTFLDMRRVRFTTNPTEVDESKNIYPAGSLPPKLHEWLLALLIEKYDPSYAFGLHLLPTCMAEDRVLWLRGDFEVRQLTPREKAIGS